ncbi:MAG: hypothetical protein MZV65_31040 [Chromatiales bacterium]|nr:hypothetical protein [Chromatiales bacterium]
MADRPRHYRWSNHRAPGAEGETVPSSRRTKRRRLSRFGLPLAKTPIWTRSVSQEIQQATSDNCVLGDNRFKSGV